MQLRKYQEELSYLTRKALGENNRVIMQGVTGMGKSRIFTDFVERTCAKRLTTVVLADRKEILEQILGYFNKFNITCQLVTSETKTIFKSQVYLCMVESFYRRYSKGWFDGIKIDLLIADEAHTANYNKVIDALPKETMVIGPTATPVASSKNHPLNKYYKSIVCGPSVQWLIENKYLVPSIDIGFNKLLDLKVMAGEFSAPSQKEQWRLLDIDNHMFKLWNQHAKNKQTIVYNRTIEHNEIVKKIFEDAGIDVGAISSKTPDDERELILDRYKHGRYQVLCNVGILTKGYDSPQTSCIVANFSTASTSKWFQTIGRGARPYEGKDNFIVLDLGNNILLHGSYGDNVDWEAIFKDEKRDRNFKVKKKPKLCNVCYAYLFNIHIPRCPVCDNLIIAKELIELEDQIPDEIKEKNPDDMNMKELVQYCKFKGYKTGFAWKYNLRNIARKQKQKHNVPGTTEET